MSLFARTPSVPSAPPTGEQRSISFQDVFGSGGDVTLFGSGIEWALRLIPVFAAQRLIIDKMASTPLVGYVEQADGTKQRMPTQPKLLTSRPFGISAATWKGQLMASLVGRGNAVGLFLGKSPGDPQVYWLNPDEVTILEPDHNRLYGEYYWLGRHLNPGEFLHIPWIVQPGKVKGLSPIGAFKAAIETGISAQTSARDWYANGAIPSGHLKSTGTVDQAKADLYKKRYKAAVAGRDVLVTGNDWDYTTIGVPADEARFIEMLRLTATQVATIYGIPPEHIGGETAGGSLEYKTVEANQIRLNQDALRPWAIRVQDAFFPLLPGKQCVEFDLDVLIQQDVKTRMESHVIAQSAGVETVQETRRAENRPPFTDAQLNEWLTLHAPKAPQPTTKGQA